uniref:Solute carrier family 38 member 6 n=1 Tax=Scophthalmus maximus TaxID=52904 RepID=A0A8D3BW54_SCOMX
MQGSVQTRAKGASFTSSVFNLMNAIMGSGILGLAYAMASTGIVGFCILLVLVSSLAAFSVHLLLKLCDQTGINSYEDLGGRALRKPGKVSVDFWMSRQGDCGEKLCLIQQRPLIVCDLSFFSRNAWYDDGRLLLILFTLCIVLPLSILPKIGFLGYTSSIAFFFMLYFAVVVMVKKWSIPCPLPLNVTSGAFQVTTIPHFLSAYAIPTMAFSFLCHTAILPIYCELDRPTKARMQNVTNVSISLSFVVYLVSALFGYLTFFANVKSELLIGYDAYMPRDIMVMTVRLAILLSVLLTVPLIHFPARKALILLLCGGRPFSWLIHIIATMSILGVVLMLAIFVPDIRNVFGVIGSTTSSSLLFIFPGIFYLKISRQPLSSFDSIGVKTHSVYVLITVKIKLTNTVGQFTH